jgi:hypothetical protein
VCSFNQICTRKAVSVSYSSWVFVDFVIKHVMRMRCIVIRGLSGSTIISHISYKRHDFREKKLLNIKCVLIVSTIFIWNISHVQKKWARYYYKCTLGLMQSARYSCQIFMKLEFSRLFFFKKYSNTKFQKNTSSGSRVVSCGRTDRRTNGDDEVNNRFSQYCERA